MSGENTPVEEPGQSGGSVDENASQSTASTPDASPNASPGTVTVDVETTTQAVSPQSAPIPIALIIEDSKIIRRLLTMQVTNLGFQVIEAENGRRGLELLAKTDRERLKVIFLDVMMPEMDGMAFLKEAKEVYGKDLAPVVVCTTKTDSKTVKDFVIAGAKAYILKPFKTETLRDKLEDLNIIF